MKLTELIKKIILEIATLCGLMMFILIIYLQFNGLDYINREMIWRFILLSSTIVFRAESLINFHNLTERMMSINYLVSSSLSDATMLILLYLYTPGGDLFRGMASSILIVFIVCKGLFYLTAYLISYYTSKKINKKLQILNG